MRRKPIVVAVAAHRTRARRNRTRGPEQRRLREGQPQRLDSTKRNRRRVARLRRQLTGSLQPAGGRLRRGDHPGRPGANFLHRTLERQGRALPLVPPRLRQRGRRRVRLPEELQVQQSGLRRTSKRASTYCEADAKLKSLKNSDILKTVFRTKEDSRSDLSPTSSTSWTSRRRASRASSSSASPRSTTSARWFVGIDELFQSDLVP